MHSSLISRTEMILRGFLQVSTAAILLAVANTSVSKEVGAKSTSYNERQPVMADSILEVKYNQSTDSHHAKNEEYFIELLELALKKSGTPYQSSAIPLENQTETRAAELLEKHVFDVHWLNTSIELENKLLPIRIPLFKGLVGWRVFLIRKSSLGTYKGISSIEQLKLLSPLQGNDWPDTKVLQHNGFSVETAREFRSLQRMLLHDHGDFFPRSLIEVWNEEDSISDGEFIVDGHLALRYPAAYYFFVAKHNTYLKDTLERGLNTAIADGSFDDLFYRYFSHSIEKSNLKSRLIFNLSNPFLPQGAPLDRKELWFNLESFLKYSK